MKTTKKIFIITLAVISLHCGKKIEELGIFGKSRNLHVLGQDGVTPVEITDSITMWTFGDTILGSWKRGVSASAAFSDSVEISGIISNSLAFTEKPKKENILDLRFTFLKKNGKVVQFIKHKQDEDPSIVRLWAVDGIKIDEKVYVFYYIINTASQGRPFSFNKSGIGIARWDFPLKWKIGDDVNFTRLPRLFPAAYPAFGSSVIRKDGYIYLTGQYADPDNTSPIKIARVKAEKIETADAYEFLGQDGEWVNDIDRAEPFMDDVMGECSLSFNSYLNKFIIIYCQMWTGKIIMVEFPDFGALKNSGKKVIYEPPAITQENQPTQVFYYSGKEIFSIEKYIYLIYINPLEYQPYLLKLKL